MGLSCRWKDEILGKFDQKRVFVELSEFYKFSMLHTLIVFI